jgi:hypothetical protein
MTRYFKIPSVTVFAFSGMVIGDLPIIDKTRNSVTLMTKSGGHLVFNSRTGKQTNPRNPKFANYIKGGI